MSFLCKVFDNLANDENLYLWSVYQRFYGPFMRLSILFISWKREELMKTFGLLILYTIALPMHFILLSKSLYLVCEDFALSSLVFHYWIIMSFTIVTFLQLNIDRKRFIKLHVYIAKPIGEYSTGSNVYDEDIPIQYENAKAKETRQFLIFPASLAIIAGICLGVPFFSKLNSGVQFNKYGVNFNLPIALYYPFPIDSGIFYLIALVGQMLAAAGLVIMLATMNVIFFRLSQSILFEFKVLRYAIQTIFARARLGCTRPNVKFQHVLGQCLKECVVHHHKILTAIYLYYLWKLIQLVEDNIRLESHVILIIFITASNIYTGLFITCYLNISNAVNFSLLGWYQQLLKWPVALAYTAGTAIIGLSLINMLDFLHNRDYENLFVFALMAIAEVLNMLVLSWFGQSITTQSEHLRDQLYSIDWYDMDVRNRKLLLNFFVGISEPTIVKGGGLITMSMETFSSIMNTAYSFFNLLNAQ